ncbi:MAG TPA: hypothetical protein VH951_02215 [Dehalococcoidia bacterium]
MQRRTLDIIVSAGGLGIVLLLIVGAVIMRQQSNFAKDTVHDQLAEQKIAFTSADKLTAADKAYTEARTGCVETYAGQDLTTGKQAECWADEYMAGHLSTMPTAANPMTYSQIGDAQTALRSQITIAKNGGNADLAASLQTQLDSLTTTRETVFKGETLRGLLLTTYGFSILGEKAALASSIAFIGAVVMLVLSVAGLVHAFVTPKTRAFAAVEEPKAARPVAAPQGT